MTFRIIRQTDGTVTPWKNGQGWTAELAISPPGATLQDFGWRISRAGTDRDAAFSQFPGVDRTLLILSGSVSLKVGEEPSIELSPESEPFRFSGEVPIFATLLSTNIVDFNVMSRRDRFRQMVERRTIEGRVTIPGDQEETVFVHLVRGHAQIAQEDLSSGDAILCDSGDGFAVHAPESADVVVCRLYRNV